MIEIEDLGKPIGLCGNIFTAKPEMLARVRREELTTKDSYYLIDRRRAIKARDKFSKSAKLGEKTDERIKDDHKSLCSVVGTIEKRRNEIKVQLKEEVYKAK